MALGKQAKTLTKPQVDAALGYLSATLHPAWNRVILLLWVKAASGRRRSPVSRGTRSRMRRAKSGTRSTF